MRTLIVFLLSFSAFANDCQYAFSKYGSGDIHTTISDACIQQVIEEASESNKASVEGLNYIAGDNVVLILDSDMKLLKMIAGEYTSLSQIMGISVNADNKEIALLEDITFEVKIFSTQYVGNMAPLRVIQTNELIGTSEIAYVGNKICAYNPIQKTTYQYSKDANVKRREEFRNLSLVGQVDGTSSISCDN